ncbi:uncharacterized protein LOC115452722 isoform X3 [Manduca sexta]|uniref:uncharacterized protein LOC115452722 isoform X3 n=1 Tax=Manduca sexta TaxID=7130 RepID=UPI00188EED2B|nr:uncharacterized protein LOC115452722 isoform X3 [Manduca sexta]
MELKSPKAKKKSNIAKLVSWGKMFRTPLLILFLLGTTSCEDDGEVAPFSPHLRHRHGNETIKNKITEIKHLRRHLNKEILNFVMTDHLMDGEAENRVHYNGITAKETYVADGLGLKLRQLTDGRHLVQVIYSQNGDIQDCEYITQTKSARNFLKTLRKELKLALDEESYILQREPNSIEDEKFFRHYKNVSIKLLKNGDKLPPDVAVWFDYNKLKLECLRRHEELKYLVESQNKMSEMSVTRSRRSFRENFILPGTKWCGAGQLAEEYNELGIDRKEDKCCRAHDNCRMNIGQFRRRFGYFNFRPYTISHCRCDRRFRACLKLADTPVSNMVGKLFFNVVQTKCFILKPVKMCTQRSWWGKCLRRGYMKQAFLRDNLPY